MVIVFFVGLRRRRVCLLPCLGETVEDGAGIGACDANTKVAKCFQQPYLMMKKVKNVDGEMRMGRMGMMGVGIKSMRVVMGDDGLLMVK